MKENTIAKKSYYCISFLFLLAIWLVGTPVKAQDVTISPSTGKLIAGATKGDEVGFQNGWSSTWRHNQLPLTLYVSDESTLTENGTLKVPAGNLKLNDAGNHYILAGGDSVRTRLNISLPKGFRFTGYKIVLSNDFDGQTVANIQYQKVDKRFYETRNNFSIEEGEYIEKTGVMEAGKDKDYTIQRTSKTADDMTNNLYFYFDGVGQNYYAVTIKSIELWFTAEQSFQVDGTPEASAISSEGKNMVAAPFKTGKLDLGLIQPNTKDSATYFSYNYTAVKELTAYNYLYESDGTYNAVPDGTLPSTPGEGNIQVLQNDGKVYYALGNGTYYIETPTSTKDQTNKDIPLGYRITGAKITCPRGTNSESGYVITYNNGDEFYYLGLDGGDNYYLKFSTTPSVWQMDDQGHLYQGNQYIYLYSNYQGDQYIYLYSNLYSNYLYTQEDSYYYYNYNYNYNIVSAATFAIENGKLTYKEDGNTYYLTYTDDGDAYMTTYPSKAVNIFSNAEYTVPASNYTVTLYGTDAKTPVQTETISATDASKVMEITGLNNDAVKFVISGLKDNTKALITYELTMEQLNPFINSLDIECTSDKKDKPKITQQFTSTDFKVAGGEFTYYVPTDYANNTCTFTFKNLYSKYMDNTYEHNTNGHSRNYLVESKYYIDYGDGEQYKTSGTEDASIKVETNLCGDKAFKFNNAEDLDNTTTGVSEASLEEYPFSWSSYDKQGGHFSTVQLSPSDNLKKCYLFTADETRYNIAPTYAMEHRAYAFYEMDLKLKTVNYDIKCTLKKVYNQTFYLKNGKEEAYDAMYGASFNAYKHGDTTTPVPDTQAFMTTSAMNEALTAALEHEKAKANQVLYLDLSNFYSVALTKDEMDDLKNKLNPNALIFLPYSTNYAADNYAKLTQTGSFQACENIVLTDQQPFYSPYKITVPAKNCATYTRKVTPAYGNTKYTLATIVLPFSLELNNGVHHNEDGSEFEVHQMNSENCLSVTQDDIDKTDDYYPDNAHFSKVQVERTQPNQPYMVNITKKSNEENTTFVATQRGSDIAATDPTKTDAGKMDEAYKFTGETAKGKIKNIEYTFTNRGSFSGIQIPNRSSVYYFAQGKFNSLKELSSRYQYLMAFPFRAWYEYTSSKPAKVMSGFNVSFEENNATTGIADVTMSQTGLSITSGRGFISIKAHDAQQVQVVSLSGQTFSDTYLMSGETERLNVPAGVYIVNNQKVIVK